MIGGVVAEIDGVECPGRIKVLVRGTGVERDEAQELILFDDVASESIEVGDRITWRDGRVRWTRRNQSIVDRPVALDAAWRAERQLVGNRA